MAQRVLGIDLGAHSTKVATLDVSLRATRLVGVRAIEVGTRGGSPVERALDALMTARAEGQQLELTSHDMINVGVPGERVLLRTFDVPFTDPRKLQAVVGNELADDIPWELEDVVYDQTPLKAAGRVLVAAARREEISDLLVHLAACEIDPRQVAVAPLAYAGLLRRTHPEDAVLLVDVGHLRTNVCLVEEGKVLLGRTVFRGGHQLTEALRQAFQLGYGEAERVKHEHGVVAVDPTQLDGARQRVAQVLGEALAPLVRELRRTCALFGQQAGARPTRVVLCGGTSLLAGIESYLELELRLPVERLRLDGDAELAGVGAGAVGEPRSVLALSLALDAGRREVLDFRQGEFAFKTDRSLFREKIFSLAASVVLVLIFASLSACASLYALEQQEAALAAELERTTKQVFGKSVSSPGLVSRMVKPRVRSKKSGEPPKMTAVDVFHLVSTHVPPKDKIKLDLKRLDIKPGKTYMRGTVDSGAAVGQLRESLADVSCFKKVVQGNISAVHGGKKDFSLTIDTTKCF